MTVYRTSLVYVCVLSIAIFGVMLGKQVCHVFIYYSYNENALYIPCKQCCTH